MSLVSKKKIALKFFRKPNETPRQHAERMQDYDNHARKRARAFTAAMHDEVRSAYSGQAILQRDLDIATVFHRSNQVVLRIACSLIDCWVEKAGIPSDRELAEYLWKLLCTAGGENVPCLADATVEKIKGIARLRKAKC